MLLVQQYTQHTRYQASMIPPEGASSYLDAMLDTYKTYVGDRKKAAAK